MGACVRGRMAGDTPELYCEITNAYAEGDCSLQTVLEGMTREGIQEELEIISSLELDEDENGESSRESRNIGELLDDLTDNLECFLSTGEYYVGAKEELRKSLEV